MTRISGIIGGIIALIIIFFAQIPIYPPQDILLDLRLFSDGNTDFYFWGYISQDSGAFNYLTGPSPENLVPLSLLCVMLFIGIASILASTRKSNVFHSLKLYKINILLILMIIFIYTILVLVLNIDELTNLITVLGMGFYGLIIVLILNYVALRNVVPKE